MNHLVLLPTHESLDMLRDLFGASPVTVNWDAVAVEIGTSVAPIEINENASYRALTGAMDVWYDSANGLSNLLLTLIPSPEMAERHAQVGDAWSRPLFFPFLNLSTDPVLRRNRRAFINSVSTRLVDLPLMLTFHGEMVITDNATQPTQADFYHDIASKGAVNRSPFFAT